MVIIRIFGPYFFHDFDKLNNCLDGKKYFELQDKIKENTRLEGLIIKAGTKIDELEFEKTTINRQLTQNDFEIKNLEKKIISNSELLFII